MTCVTGHDIGSSVNGDGAVQRLDPQECPQTTGDVHRLTPLNAGSRTRAAPLSATRDSPPCTSSTGPASSSNGSALRPGPRSVIRRRSSATRYATVLFWKPQVGLFVNESTLLPVLLPFAPAATVIDRLPKALAPVLRRHGIGEAFIEDDCAAMADHRLAKTKNRSVSG